MARKVFKIYVNEVKELLKGFSAREIGIYLIVMVYLNDSPLQGSAYLSNGAPISDVLWAYITKQHLMGWYQAKRHFLNEGIFTTDENKALTKPNFFEEYKTYKLSKDVRNRQEKIKNRIKKYTNIQLNVYEVFQEFKRVLSPKTRLKLEAKYKIRNRLKYFTQDELYKAIELAKKYNAFPGKYPSGPASFFKSNERIEHFLNLEKNDIGGIKDE